MTVETIEIPVKEVTDLQTIKTTCAYCGVGCGIQATVSPSQRTVEVKGDPEHPSNFGRLCSKGSALAETLDLSSRLLEPQIYGRPASWDDAISMVASKFQQVIDEHGPDAVAFYGSGQLLTEDYYVANKLMKGFIGSGNMDTNSRLCMSSSVSGHKRAFGSDTVPNCYEDYEHTDLIVLVGSNTAWCHPVSFQRIRQAKENNPNLKVVVIDPRKTDSCDIADLHVPVKVGSDVALFNGLLAYLYQENALDQDYIDQHTEGFDQAIQAAQLDAFNVATVAEKCRLAPHVVETFYRWFKETNKTLTLYSQGVNQSSSGSDKVNAIINCHLATGRIGKEGAGPFSLTGQPNAMGGREVGGLATQLAAHMEFSEQDRDIVQRFWQSDNVTDKPGLPAVDLFDAVADGKIKAIWIMATNPVVSLPNADKVKQALQQCEFVVVSDCVAHTDTLDLAHVKLPAAGWSEKDGTVTNSERRISRQRALLPLAGNAKPDWWIITQVARKMGFENAFPYETPVDVFREHARFSGFENSPEQRLRSFNISGLAEITDEQYQSFPPTQWPIVSSDALQDINNFENTKRLFAEGGFFTPTRKAKFVAVEHRAPKNAPDANWPLILNTGRLRDQWHTMTRTGLSARLNQHKPEPFVEITSADAQANGLEQGQLALIESQWGKMLARVTVTDRIAQGEIFVPMHWTDQFSSHSRMGGVVNPVVDPVSFQPESKHTPVRISAFSAAWHGFILSRHPLVLDGIDYVVLAKGNGYFRYELAGKRDVKNWQGHLAYQLKPYSGELDWQTFQDQTKKVFRTACFHEGELQAVLITGPDSHLPEREWIGSLFDPARETELEADERMALLTGKPPLGTPDVGKIVCACFNVGAKTIENAIKDGKLTTPQEVGKCCKAGTNCGSCVPEIKGILAAVGK
ncbi:nitrate reductase [Litoribrevibacter albus]|uniref:Nitrate reductase n=1 Tax=Litoribrevibacter albus TaxID=1473156 RepID=A0AA37SE84_9GAMM|nr:nitrate reductase [Litoribrevibacter albus]GLQ33428.1 nitrate reductase [Litoribrevibacter albus]